MNKLLLAALLCWNGVAWAHTELDSLVRSVEGRTVGRPLELLYVQTSKTTYETGEDLWFKAYQFDARSLGLSDSSQTLYLQVVGPGDSVVWAEKYPIEQGLAVGHVYVGLHWPSGEYLMEAYSRGSCYGDTLSGPSVRKIRVVERIAADTVGAAPAVRSLRFAAYPEGGDLVAGVPGVVAFEAMDQNGRPMEVEGVLQEEGSAVQAFRTTLRGMGKVGFTPAVGKRYRLVLSDGTVEPLAVLPAGLALRLTDQTKDYLECTVFQSPGTPPQTVRLVAQVRGAVCCAAQGVVADRLPLRLPLTELMHGVAEVTLYDQQGRPVAERLVYAHPEQQLRISVRPSQQFYATRQKASIEIRTTDPEGNPVRAHLGVSVLDGAYDDPSLRSTIASHCLLSAQIRGQVFDPAYYFDPKNPDADQALELLLLTRGWRRYVWRSVEEARTVFPPLLTDEIMGVLSLPSRGKRAAVPSIQAIHLSGAKGGSVVLWVDSLGRFAVDVPTMKQLRAGALYLRPLAPEERIKPSIELNDGFAALAFARSGMQRLVPVGDTVQKKAVAIDELIRSDDGSTLLEAIVVSAKGRLPRRDKVLGRLDSLMQAQAGPYECEHGSLENYLPGYTHHHDLSLCPCATMVKEPRPPVIGKRYEIFKPEYFPCPKQGGWCFKVLDRKVVTYTGIPYTEEELLRMNGMWKAQGYYGQREFYCADQTDAQSSTPDPRNTLLWNPSVVTDEGGRATVEFYCSDLNTGFVVAVEGTDGAGLLGTGRGEFRVIKKGPSLFWVTMPKIVGNFLSYYFYLGGVGLKRR